MRTDDIFLIIVIAFLWLGAFLCYLGGEIAQQIAPAAFISAILVVLYRTMWRED
jgi:hypothetical protein